MANDLTPANEGGVPDFIRQRTYVVNKGNIDASDLRPPRLKMLAGMSPEVMNGVPGARPGDFWMTILGINLGQQVTGTPVFRKKTYQVWAPKVAGNENKGPLATSSDGVHWDVPNQVFEVKFFGIAKPYQWRIGKLVTDFNANKFGSQQPENKSSKPIATLTYDVLWLIDLPNGAKQLCVFTSSRTGATPTQTFFATAETKGIDYIYQRWAINSEKRQGPTGDPYYTYSYQYIGPLMSNEECDFTAALNQQYAASGFVVDSDEEGTTESPPRQEARQPAVQTFNQIDEEIPF